jgi:hypothetical protein
MKLFKPDADGIDPRTLLLAKVLSTAAYSGLLLFLPSMLADRIWRTATDVGDVIIRQAIGAWTDDVELVQDVFSA